MPAPASWVHTCRYLGTYWLSLGALGLGAGHTPFALEVHTRDSSTSLEEQAVRETSFLEFGMRCQVSGQGTAAAA